MSSSLTHALKPSLQSPHQLLHVPANTARTTSTHLFPFPSWHASHKETLLQIWFHGTMHSWPSPVPAMVISYWLYGWLHIGYMVISAPHSARYPQALVKIFIALAPHRKVLLCPQAHTPATLSSVMTHRDAKHTSPFPQCMSLLPQSTPVFSPPHHLILFCLQIYRPLPHLLGALRGQGYFPLQHLALGKSS